MQYLLDKGHAANEIAVLQTVADTNLTDPRGQLDPGIASQVELLTHHPGQREELGYLCADEAGNPIYFHRSLIEAILSSRSCRPNNILNHYTEQVVCILILATQRASDRHQEAQEIQIGYEAQNLRKPLMNCCTRHRLFTGRHVGIRVIGGGPDELYALHVGQVDTIQQQSSQQLAQLWRTEVAGRSS